MISVIVPIYNAEKTLKRCLDSIINQTYKDLDIILIDDGSTDGSAEIIEECRAKDERVQSFVSDNYGASAARNTGIEMAMGDWLMFVDADDYLEPDAVAELAQYDADLVMGDYFIGKGDSYILDRTYLWDYYNINNYLIQYLERPRGHALFVYCWANLFKTDIIKKYHIRFDTDMTIFEDGFFMMDYIESIQSAVYIRKHIYHFTGAHEWGIYADPLRFKDMAFRIAQNTWGLNVDQALVSYAIKQMVRFYELDPDFNTPELIARIVKDVDVRKALKKYKRCEGDSWTIPLFMRLGWVRMVARECKRRAECG